MDWLAEFAPEAGEAEPTAEAVDTAAVAEELADWLPRWVMLPMMT